MEAHEGTPRRAPHRFLFVVVVVFTFTALVVPFLVLLVLVVLAPVSVAVILPIAEHLVAPSLPQERRVEVAGSGARVAVAEAATTAAAFARVLFLGCHVARQKPDKIVVAEQIVTKVQSG